MSYTSLADLANDIRANLWKVPSDVSLIVGVPRSGLMAAILVGEYLHIPVQDLQAFLRGEQAQMGGRGKHMHRLGGRVLVMDDTIFSGRSMENVKKQVQTAGKDANVIYGCVYAEGKNAERFCDVFFVNNYNPKEELWHLYEWNILQHGLKLSSVTMYDLDGVLCLDPPDEKNVQEYEQYIVNARTMIIPSTMVGAIVTYRRERYREITERWLRTNGVQYDKLIMRSERFFTRNNDDAAYYKAMEYRNAQWARLFVESNARQAEIISSISGKQVFCYADGKMY